MIAKYVLPWFGGTPTVWSTVMLFFQALLTGGYAYAYGLAGRIAIKRQSYVHLALFGISILVLLVTGSIWNSPITPDAAWRPRGVDSPIGDIFKILAVSVGLPYFLLASNSPLAQAWFTRSYPGRSPHRLYALSNVGSLLALMSYPVLIEPALSLKIQGQVWSLGYFAFALIGAVVAVRMVRTPDIPAARPESSTAPRPSLGLCLLWIALAACASVLLRATTSQMTQEIAVVPFLWVLPLAIYLLSFILCFDSERWYARTPYTIAFSRFLIRLRSPWVSGSTFSSKLGSFPCSCSCAA